MNTLLPVALYIQHCLTLINAESKAIETSIIREFGACEGVKRISFHLERITVNVTGRGTTTFNGLIDVDEDLDHITQMECRVEKCNSYGDAATCEFYTTYRFNDPCEKIMMLKEGPWAALFNTKPSLPCPVKKGSYELHESSVNTKLLTTFGDVYWKFIIKLFIGKRVVSCVKGGIEKTVVRRKLKTKAH